MSLDDFISQNYGDTSAAAAEEDGAKLASAQFFLKVAADNGIDINNLNDAQVSELWNTVWSTKLAEEEQCDKEERAKKEHDKKKEEAKEAQAQFVQADEMGRVMAHSYVSNLQKIAAAGGLDFMKEASDEPGRIARAGRYIAGAVTSTPSQIHEGAKGLRDTYKFMRGADGKGAGRVRAAYEAIHHNPEKKELLKGVGKATGAATALGGAGYGGYHALKKDDAEKTSSAIDELAAQYAIEKAAAYGCDPEEVAQRVSAVLVLGPGESEKVAYVNNLESAVDVRSSELLELAGYPVDWTGTGFEKEAGKVTDAIRKYAPGVQDIEAGHFLRKCTANAAKGSTAAAEHRAGTKRMVKGILKATGATAGTAAAVGGGVYAATRKKDDGDKEASANFDNIAAEIAVEKAASVGWDPEYVAERINSVFTLGYEGDPMDSVKVASVDDSESALHMRACELLEIAGFNINW